jgi:hypothetical protein
MKELVHIKAISNMNLYSLLLLLLVALGLQLLLLHLLNKREAR